MTPKRVCLILDNNLNIAEWQFDSLKFCIDRQGLQIVSVLLCQNTKTRKNPIRFLYYLIRALIMRPESWKLVSAKELIDESTEIIGFDSQYDGSWQSIPENVLQHLKKQDLDFAIKFEMGLLKNTDNFPSKGGILSYHHGDPYHYRGRPAGFYEIFNNANYIGSVVQRLTDQLDAGEVKAMAKSTLVPYSYKKSLQNLYESSIPLLYKSMFFPIKDAKKPNGKNYSLPGNLKVLFFILKLQKRLLLKLIYGLCYEKSWKLGLQEGPISQLTDADFTLSVGKAMTPPSGYKFLADGFFSQSEPHQIYCEALNQKSGKGEILKIDCDGHLLSSFTHKNSSQHYSYPYTFIHNNAEYIFAETAGHTSPTAAEVTTKGGKVHKLSGIENLRILDPTIIHYDDLFWLFGSPKGKADQLYLWHSENILGPYKEHAQNPIVLDPENARPAGRILNINGRHFRPSQLNGKSYGNGIQLSEIITLNKQIYEEKLSNKILVANFKGPHTIDYKDGNVLFDYYSESFNPLAFLTRIKGRL